MQVGVNHEQAQPIGLRRRIGGRWRGRELPRRAKYGLDGGIQRRRCGSPRRVEADAGNKRLHPLRHARAQRSQYAAMEISSRRDGRAASATELQLLAKAAAIPGVDLVLITDRAQIDRPPARLLVRDSGLRVSGGRQGALGVGRPGLPAFCFASDRAGHQTRLRQPADRGSEPSAGVRQPPWPTGTAAGPRHAPVGSSVIA
jgi:hypothetical protein